MRAKRKQKRQSLAGTSSQRLSSVNSTIRAQRRSTLKHQPSLKEQVKALNADANGSANKKYQKITRGSVMFETGFSMQSYKPAIPKSMTKKSRRRSQIIRNSS